MTTCRVSPASDDLTCRVSPASDDLSSASVASAGGGDTSFDARQISVSEIPERRCLWCRGVISGSTRRDAKFCKKSCRQSSWRFRVCRADIEATDRPMIFAYADPPYPGKASLYPERTEVDHASLLQRLTENYPDGWALSTSSEALRDVLSLCPRGVRVCAWFKGPRHTKSRRALVSWEPLIVAGGRSLQINVAQDLSDGLVARGRFRRFPGAMVGMKPPAFAEWMFRQLGALRGDRLDDLFPGSGAIRRAWARYTATDPAVTIVRSDSSMKVQVSA
jgi:hypothetical protein